MFGYSIWQLLLLVLSSIFIWNISYSRISFLNKILVITLVVVAMRNLVLN